MLTFALPKGRLAEKTLELLAKIGIECDITADDRRLVVKDKSGEIAFIFVKPSDVPTYVERGAADIGAAGKDTLLEAGKDIYEMLDLKFGACRLCIAGRKDNKNIITNHNLRVATKYVDIAKKYYAAKNTEVDIIKLNGSVELAPLLDMADVILDLVESGRTLKENNLFILEEVCLISARLAVNKVSLKTKAAEIRPLLAKIQEVTK